VDFLSKVVIGFLSLNHELSEIISRRRIVSVCRHWLSTWSHDHTRSTAMKRRPFRQMQAKIDSNGLLQY